MEKVDADFFLSDKNQNLVRTNLFVLAFNNVTKGENVVKRQGQVYEVGC